MTEAATTTAASAHTEQFGGDVQIIDIFDNFQDNLYFRHFPPSTLHLAYPKIVSITQVLNDTTRKCAISYTIESTLIDKLENLAIFICCVFVRLAASMFPKLVSQVLINNSKAGVIPQRGPGSRD